MARKRKNPSSERRTPLQRGEQEQPSNEQSIAEQEPTNPDQQATGNEEKEDGQPENMIDEEDLEEEDEEQDDQEAGTESENPSNDVASDEEAPPSDANGGGVLDAEDEELEEEPAGKLLGLFSKEQLVVLLNEALSKYPDFIDIVKNLADTDPAHRKIFVHGLGWDTNADTLASAFGKYGEIEDCKAVCDKVSGKSKGYGFILFKHRSGARKALKQPQKKIGNRMTSCQLASAGPVQAPPPTVQPVSEYTQRKIFVSNVSAELDPQKLLEFFSKYGEIEEGPLGLDKQTGKPKGFALFVYKTIESAQKALQEPHKNFEGHTVHCQKAVDGPKPNKQPYYQQQHHQQQQHNQYQYHPSKKGKYSSSGGAGSGQLMMQSGPSVGFNPAVAAPSLNPSLGQALTALTALAQGAGLLGGLGGPVNQGVPPVMNNAGYGNQSSGGYASQNILPGGYQNLQMGQGGGRPQQGGPSYFGRGH